MKIDITGQRAIVAGGSRDGLRKYRRPSLAPWTAAYPQVCSVVGVGGCVVGGGVLPPFAELFEPMTTPAHPLPSTDAASTRTARHFDLSRTPDR